MNTIAAIAVNTYRETVRDKVLYNLVLFALILIGSSYLLSHISIYQEVRIIKDLGLAAIAIFGIVIGVFIGIGLVSKEIDRRTLYGLLPKPVSRAQFILGKFLGLSLTLAVNVAIMTAGLYAVLFYMTRSFEPSLLKAVYLIYFQLTLVTAVALLFSSFTSSVLSGVMTGFIYVAGHFSSDLKNFETVVDSVWAQKVALALYYLLPNLRNFDVKNRVVAGDEVPFSLLALATGYGLAYLAILLLGAVLIFQRRSLK
jgi:ABC-type transport system involved in multi-copper enzyme maturation permease subunit